jgi:hypothetical protein
MSVQKHQQMEGTVLVVRGVVKGRMIVLPDSIQLTEGAEVEVRVRPERRRRVSSSLSEVAFKKKLHEAGLLKEWRSPGNIETTTVRAPVQVEGQPLSEMIVAERR